MNILFGKCNWNAALSERIQEARSFNNGILELYVERIHSFDFDSKNIFYNDKTKILCAIIGYISNLQEVRAKNSLTSEHDIEIIEKLYSLKGPNFISDLDGLFTIFLFDENERKGYIFQDEYGSNSPLYYTHTKDGFSFSSSLKKLLKETPIKREINSPAINDFLYYRFIIPNEKTLIKDVYKLVLSNYLIIDCNKHSFTVEKIEMGTETLPLATAKNNLMTSLEQSVNKLSALLRHRNLACALSSGFDTNLILNYLVKHAQDDVLSVTIGGKIRNEIPAAKMCASQYTNVRHLGRLVEMHRIESLPDIIWRNESYLVERGIFLAYELGQALKKEKRKTVFLGDGADQQLDQTRAIKGLNTPDKSGAIVIKEAIRKSFIGTIYLVFKRIISKKCREVLHKSLKDETPKLLVNLPDPSSNAGYDILLDFILKKNGLILNSNDIQGIYPFLNKQTKIICRSLGMINKKKKYYKKETKRVLGRKKSRYLTKLIGSTDIWYLFKDRKDLTGKLLTSNFVKKILNKEQIAKINETPHKYNMFILQLFSMYLFNELFISGKFDLEFDCPNLDTPLDAFFDSTNPTQK